MAQFDLKQANMYILDKYGADVSGYAVNNASGYVLGATTMAIDGGSRVLVVGDTFTVAGDTVLHKITSKTDASGVTTSITFTPGLGGAVVDNAVITIGPHKLYVKIGDGNLTFSEKRPMQYIKDRGKLDSVRLGDEEPLDVRLDFQWEFLSSETGAIIPTIKEALKQQGAASNWVTTGRDPCEPYAVDIHIEYTPFCATSQRELVILPEFRWEDLAHDAKAGHVAVTGKCNVVASTDARVNAF